MPLNEVMGVTLMVTLEVTACWPGTPFAVAVNVVVADSGETVYLPLAGTPWLNPALLVITTDEALEEVQESVMEVGARMLVALAVKLTVTAGGGFTVTVADAVVLPPDPVAVKT